MQRDQEDGTRGRGVPYRSAEGDDSAGGSDDGRGHKRVEDEALRAPLRVAISPGTLLSALVSGQILDLRD